MDAETASDDSPAEHDAPLPGARLRETREGQGLTVEEVAERLRLTATQIRALESDNFKYFPAPIYVIGYVRKYAELLDLDATPLVAGLEQSALKTPSIKSELASGRTPMPVGHGMPPAVWLGVAILGVVVLLAALWWWTRPAPLTIETASDDSAPVIAAPTETPDTAPPEVVTPEPPGSDPGVSEPAALLAPASPQAPIAPVEPVAPPETPAAAVTTDELVLIFSGSSWIEVVDATGRRLAYRMGNEGDLLTLQGQPPFDILLGNAQNVSVEYNGEPWRDVPVNRHNVASFTLGHPADEQ